MTPVTLPFFAFCSLGILPCRQEKTIPVTTATTSSDPAYSSPTQEQIHPEHQA